MVPPYPQYPDTAVSQPAPSAHTDITANIYILFKLSIKRTLSNAIIKIELLN